MIYGADLELLQWRGGVYVCVGGQGQVGMRVGGLEMLETEEEIGKINLNDQRVY